MDPVLKKCIDNVGTMTRVDKVALVALALRAGFPLVEALAGVRLPGAAQVGIFFIISVLLFLIFSFPKHFRTLFMESAPPAAGDMGFCRRGSDRPDLFLAG